MNQMQAADLALKFHDKFTSSDNTFLLVAKGDSVSCTRATSELGERTMRVMPEKVIGTYDADCTLEWLMEDICHAMRVQ